jgi:IclR family transcriptional regulator, KDG regulon repressor
MSTTPDDIRPSPLRDRSGVQSLERGFAIIEAVASHRDGVSLKDLSRDVGLHSSTTFHLVQTLVTLGYIQQLADTKRYRLGRRLFALAGNMLDEIELVSIAKPILEELSSSTGEASHFAIGSGYSAVMIARTAGSGVFQLASHVGVVRPLHCTAIGKIILAAMSAERIESFLASGAPPRLTANTICNLSRLRREIKTIAVNGVAYDDAEFNEELRCIAVPVRDFSGQTLGALGISAPTWRLSLAELSLKAEDVRRCAVKLSAEIGGRANIDAESSSVNKRRRSIRP